jgi:hypothetical protein
MSIVACAASSTPCYIQGMARSGKYKFSRNLEPARRMVLAWPPPPGLPRSSGNRGRHINLIVSPLSEERAAEIAALQNAYALFERNPPIARSVVECGGLRRFRLRTRWRTPRLGLV